MICVCRGNKIPIIFTTHTHTHTHTQSSNDSSASSMIAMYPATSMWGDDEGLHLLLLYIIALMLYSQCTRYPVPTSTPESTEASSAPPVLSQEAIIGIAVGGGSVLGSVLILCLCICVCCLCIKVRQKKKLNPSVSEKQPIDEISPAYRTLTPPDLSLDLVKNEVTNATIQSLMKVLIFSLSLTLYIGVWDAK